VAGTSSGRSFHDGHGAEHSTRLVVAYEYASLILVVLGLSWAGFFASIGWWRVVGLDLLLIVVGVASYLLIRRANSILAFSCLKPH
jgi:uncharacterized membrane protein